MSDEMHVWKSECEWVIAASEAEAVALVPGLEDDDDFERLHPMTAVTLSYDPAAEIGGWLRTIGTLKRHGYKPTKHKPYGDGWTHTITAPAGLWAQHHPPGFLASSEV